MDGCRRPEKFLWRISAATISGPNTFSNFPGFDRWLSVIEGPGLKLNSRKLLYGNCFRFSGDDTIECETLGGSVTDLGIIFDRASVKAEMKFIKAEAGFLTVKEDVDFTFAFVCRGAVSIDSVSANQGDTVSLSGLGPHLLSCSQNSELILVTVNYHR